jgi:hypothetical protein
MLASFCLFQENERGLVQGGQKALELFQSGLFDHRIAKE